MSHAGIVEKHFPGAMKEGDFVEKTRVDLGRLGFTADNAIACVALCRDELTSPLMDLIRQAWGESFNLSSLAGMFFAGRTGLEAALHHAPDVGGRHRYIFYAMPHIAVGKDGTLGACSRKGLERSTACGALSAFLDELQAGKLNVVMDDDDIEQSILRMRLLREIPYGRLPDLLELTFLAQKVIQADLERAVGLVVDHGRSDHALITGVQVHAPDGNYIHPLPGYAVVDAARRDL